MLLLSRLRMCSADGLHGHRRRRHASNRLSRNRTRSQRKAPQPRRRVEPSGERPAAKSEHKAAPAAETAGTAAASHDSHGFPQRCTSCGLS